MWCRSQWFPSNQSQKGVPKEHLGGVRGDSRSFFDMDLDGADLGGRIDWIPPAEELLVTSYVATRLENARGDGVESLNGISGSCLELHFWQGVHRRAYIQSRM